MHQRHHLLHPFWCVWGNGLGPKDVKGMVVVNGVEFLGHVDQGNERDDSMIIETAWFAVGPCHFLVLVGDH